MLNKKPNAQIETILCAIAMAILSTLKFGGILDIPLIWILLMPVFYLVYVTLELVFAGIVIEILDLFFDIFGSVHYLNPGVNNTPPMYWDPEKQQFWSPEYGVIDFGHTYQNKEEEE